MRNYTVTIERTVRPGDYSLTTLTAGNSFNVVLHPPATKALRALRCGDAAIHIRTEDGARWAIVIRTDGTLCFRNAAKGYRFEIAQHELAS